MHSPTAGDPKRIGWRLFFTVWLIYSVFATTNVVRETYLAVAIGNDMTVRVDEYQGLHPDLFEMPGRGWYINSNPGASLVAALPYALLVRPAIALATRMRPGIAAPKPPATYDDPRPNRTRFMNAARARGLDVILGLAAVGTGVTVMAPLGALAAVLMYLFLRARLGDARQAVGLALVFAFATPMFFRAGFLNQNAIVAYLVLASWLLMVGVRPRTSDVSRGPRTLLLVGILQGFAMVCDFSAIPFAVIFGFWILWNAWRRGGIGAALHDGVTYVAGAAISLSLLFAYQWIAFGHPLWPAQRYMPPTEYSVRGWFGFSVPTAGLLWGNLFDPRYGLFAFCPLLLIAFAAPFVRNTDLVVSRAELFWIGACYAGLLLFNSANQFAHLQFNTGVRYMVPAVPLLFLALIPVLQRMPKVARATLIGLSLAISIAVSMTREDVRTGLRLVLEDGPTLPVLIVVRKMASGYAISLPSATFWLVALVIAAVLYLIWRPVRWRTAAP